jgi:hypothetical protein
MVIKRERFGKEYPLAFNDIYSDVLQTIAKNLIVLSIKIKPTEESSGTIDINESVWSIAKAILDIIHKELNGKHCLPIFKRQGISIVSTLLFLDLFSNIMSKFIPEYAYKQTLSHVLSNLYETYPDIYNILEDIRQTINFQAHNTDETTTDLICLISRVMVEIVIRDIEEIVPDGKDQVNRYGTTKPNDTRVETNNNPLIIDAYDGLQELFEKAFDYTKNNLIIA